MSNPRPVGIEEVLTALRKGWFIVVAGAVMAGVIAYSWSSDQPKVYESEASLVIAPAPSTDRSEIIDISAGLERESIVTTLAEVIGGSMMRDQAAEAAHLAGVDIEPYVVEAAATPLANVVSVTVRGPDDEVVEQLASALVQSSSAYFEGVYPIYQVDVLNEPSQPTGPVEPTPKRDAAIAAFAGAMLGVAIAVAMWGWRRRSVDRRPPMPAGGSEVVVLPPEPTLPDLSVDPMAPPSAVIPPPPADLRAPGVEDLPPNGRSGPRKVPPNRASLGSQ